MLCVETAANMCVISAAIVIKVNYFKMRELHNFRALNLVCAWNGLGIFQNNTNMDIKTELYPSGSIKKMYIYAGTYGQTIYYN
jgi:hypothetical protein